jgi:hypothetical protein
MIDDLIWATTVQQQPSSGLEFGRRSARRKLLQSHGSVSIPLTLTYLKEH